MDISGHGRELISFCKLTRYKIVNGRLGYDKEKGNYSCHTVTGSSIVDYCLTRERNSHLIDNFYVSDINTLSDHAFLSIRLTIRNVKETNDGVEKSYS